METFNKDFKSYITSDESIVLDCRVEREGQCIANDSAGGTLSGMMGKKGGAIMAKEHQVLVIAKIHQVLVHVFWHSLIVVALALQK